MINFINKIEFKNNWQFYTLAFFVFFLPFQFALNVTTGIDLASARVAILVFFLFFICKTKLSFSFKNDTISKLLLLFLFLAAFSTIFTDNVLWSLRKLLFLFSIFPIYLISIKIFRNELYRINIIKAFVFGAALVSLFSIIQFFSQFIFGIERVYLFLGKYTAPFFLGNTFSKMVLDYPSWLVASQGTTYMRAVGSFPDPHMLSYYLGLSLPWAISLAIISKKSKLFWIASLFILFADIITFTRGGYVALIASAIIVSPLLNKNGLKKIILAVILIASLLFIVPNNPIAGRLNSSFDSSEGSNQARLSNWQQASLIIKQNPMGVGIGMYPLAVDRNASYRTPIYAHNIYLDIAAEMGIISALTFIAILTLVFLRFWKFAKTNYFYIAGVASITLFTVHSMVETPLYSVHILPIFFIIVAMAASMKKNEDISA